MGKLWQNPSTPVSTLCEAEPKGKLQVNRYTGVHGTRDATLQTRLIPLSFHLQRGKGLGWHWLRNWQKENIGAGSHVQSTQGGELRMHRAGIWRGPAQAAHLLFSAPIKFMNSQNKNPGVFTPTQQKLLNIDSLRGKAKRMWVPGTQGYAGQKVPWG